MRNSAFCILFVLAASGGCSSDPDNTAPGAGNLTGTLYFNSEKNNVSKLDLATGTYTDLGDGESCVKTKQGTLLCSIDNNLADAPEALTTYRHIDDNGFDTADNHSALFLFPRQSPDGTKVVFQSFEGEIIVVDFQTGALIATITADAAKVNEPLGFGRPSWTPDGRIVFSSASGQSGIFLTDAAFSNNLTRIDPNLANSFDAMVSHNGKFVAYVSSDRIWKMGIDGSNPIQIDTSTAVNTKDVLPEWSPDDTVIIWPGGDTADLQLHAADGTGETGKLFTLYPDLKNHVLTISIDHSIDWVP